MVLKKRSAIIVVALIVLILGTMPIYVSESRVEMNTCTSHSIAQSQTDLSGITVGIYYIGYLDSRVNNSLTALINMFRWMNATVRIFNKTDIINGALWACEVLSIPGSYIGVRGSAAMAVKDSYFENSWTEFKLALIDGTSYEVEDLGHTTITNVTINRECTGPDLSDMPETMSVLFKTGRYILPNEGQELIYIANYTHNNLPAMVASHYGDGNVFISSPHFEYEENDDRDGTDYLDSYDDPDSEWPFMLTMTQWLIDSSPTVCNLTQWPITTLPMNQSLPTNQSIPINPGLPIEVILVGGGLGIVVLAVIVMYVRKR